jgi:hypothetical protein
VTLQTRDPLPQERWAKTAVQFKLLGTPLVIPPMEDDWRAGSRRRARAGGGGVRSPI